MLSLCQSHAIRKSFKQKVANTTLLRIETAVSSFLSKTVLTSVHLILIHMLLAVTDVRAVIAFFSRDNTAKTMAVRLNQLSRLVLLPNQRNFSSAAVSLAYNRYGTANDKNTNPLVIGHGLFGHKQNWNSIAKALQQRLQNQIFVMLVLPSRGFYQYGHILAISGTTETRLTPTRTRIRNWARTWQLSSRKSFCRRPVRKVSTFWDTPWAAKRRHSWHSTPRRNRCSRSSSSWT